MTKKQAYIALALGATLAVSSVAPAFAAENSDGSQRMAPRGVRASTTSNMRQATSPMKPARGVQGNPGGVFDFGKEGGPITAGKVTAVNGTSFTLESIAVRRSTTTKAVATSTVVFTVDASKAPIMKNKSTTTVSSILVGDAVVVKGKVSGTSIVAKAIIDVGSQAVPTRPGMMKGDRGEHGSTTASSTMPGRPVGAEDRPRAPEVKQAGFFNRVTNFFSGWFK